MLEHDARKRFRILCQQKLGITTAQVLADLGIEARLRWAGHCWHYDPRIQVVKVPLNSIIESA